MAGDFEREQEREREPLRHFLGAHLGECLGEPQPDPVIAVGGVERWASGLDVDGRTITIERAAESAGRTETEVRLDLSS